MNSLCGREPSEIFMESPACTMNGLRGRERCCRMDSKPLTTMNSLRGRELRVLSKIRRQSTSISQKAGEDLRFVKTEKLAD